MKVVSALKFVDRIGPRGALPGSQYLLDVEFLWGCYETLGKDKAPGIDGQSWYEYGRNLDENLRDLFRHLLRRGVGRKHAVVTAFSQRRAWSQSITMGMHRAYLNAWFESRVYMLWNEWQRKHPGPFKVSDGQYLLFNLEKAL